ncbi:MAG: hypothetical protein ABSA33_00010 [Candidatus Micrarchaeaceae archaeon]|jgi:hypothetical protein
MRRYNLLCYTIISVVAAVLLSNIASAQYWFQSGGRAISSADLNNGAGVTIQTVYQNATYGSLGFWIGETLSNGAFIQVGYEITNSTGYYSSSCLNQSKSVFLRAGDPAWFWEYFQPGGSNNQSFCGGIGPNGSAGSNNTFDTYSFKSNGDIWDAYFNGQEVGSINLGTDNSGVNPPAAFAEYADTNKNTWPIKNVTFKNMFFYIGNNTRSVPVGYSSISYGEGSLTTLPNVYGVEEVGNYTNYFVVGSSVPLLHTLTKLWQIGYNIGIYSAYGNLTSSNNYTAYTVVPLSAPDAINISQGVREAFTGWTGSGYGSYTGVSASHSVTLYDNITETAEWHTQYYLNVTSQYGNVSGGGWYDANSTGTISVSSSTVAIGPGSRVVFDGWSTGAVAGSTPIRVDGPQSIQAIWTRQYYLNATSAYGNATGSGWYDSNSTANVSLTGTTVPINQTQRLAFKQWSDGRPESSISLKVNSPIMINAVFERQYLVTLTPENAEGAKITGVNYYNVSGENTNRSIFAFAGTEYNIEYIYYKGVIVTVDHQFNITGVENVAFMTPVYNIVVNTQSVFGTPVNASLNITFKNNTSTKTYSGNDGNMAFNNVPYGYVTGYAEYFGVKQSVNLENGVSSYLVFFTASLMALIISGIVIIVAVARITAEYERSRRPKEIKKSY